MGFWQESGEAFRGKRSLQSRQKSEFANGHFGKSYGLAMPQADGT